MVPSKSLRASRAVILVALSATQASASDSMTTLFSAGCRPREVQTPADLGTPPVIFFKIGREERAKASGTPLQRQATAAPQMRASTEATETTEVIAPTGVMAPAGRWPAKEVRATPALVTTGIPEVRIDGMAEQKPCA